MEEIKLYSGQTVEDRFKACKEILESQSHSGCSYYLVSKSMASIHKDGVKFVEYLKNNA